MKRVFNLVFFLITISIVHKSRAQSCLDKVQSACQGTTTRISMVNNPDGTLLLDPRYPPENILSNTQLQQLIASSPNGINSNNMTHRIQPLFESLKSQLLEQARNMPDTNPLKTHLIQRLSSVRLQAQDWLSSRGDFRCQRAAYPFGASIDDASNVIRICPWMTHLDARSLLSVLAHELGHLVDPCHNTEQASVMGGLPFENIHRCLRQNNATTNPLLVFPVQHPQSPIEPKQHCGTFPGEEDEYFADFVSAQLTANYIQNHPQTFNGLSDNQKIGTLLNYRILSERCSIQTTNAPRAYLQTPPFQQLMGCSSLGQNVSPICNAHTFEDTQAPLARPQDSPRSTEQ